MTYERVSIGRELYHRIMNNCAADHNLAAVDYGVAVMSSVDTEGDRGAIAKGSSGP